MPRFYLAGFAQGKIVTTVSLATSASFRQTILNASAENNFYTVDNDDDPDAFEKALSTVEAGTARVFETIRTGGWPLPEHEREQLAYFLAVQALRGRHHRKMMNSAATDLIRHAIASGGIDAFRAALGDNADELSDEEIERGFELATTPGRFRVQFPAEAHVEQIGELADDVEPSLSMRRWNLVRFDEPALLTSDRPVALVHDATDPWMTAGYATAIGVTFPIDRSTGLIMGEVVQDVTDMVTAGTPLHRDLLNTQSVRNAHEQVFHHPDDSDLFRNLFE